MTVKLNVGIPNWVRRRELMNTQRNYWLATERNIQNFINFRFLPIIKYKIAPSIGINTTTIIQNIFLFFLYLFFSISTKADTHNRMKKAIISIDLILNIGGIISFSGFEISFSVNPVYNFIGLCTSISIARGFVVS